MSEFVSIENLANAATFEQETTELLEARFEGWAPAEGNVLVWLNKAFSRIGAAVSDQASVLSAAAFKGFGEKVVSIPPVQAAAASVESTWTMVDAAGYTIPAGTQVTIAASGDTVVGFITVGDVVVAPEATAAAVLLQAVEPGEAGNGLSADPELSDSRAFVKGIVSEGVTSGGVDEEEEDAYLSRLVEELQTLSTSLILPRDFEIDARAVAGIARAKCIRNYDAETEEEGVALCQTIFPITTAGLSPSAPIKEALLARQVDKLLTDVKHFVDEPTYTTIDGESEVEIESGFDPATVLAALEARWLELFDPAKWGLPKQGDSGSGWENQIKVYRLKIIGELERLGGVARVVTFKHAKNPEALGTAEELTLSGIAPLTKPGTFEVSAV